MVGRVVSGAVTAHQGWWLGLLDDIDLVHASAEYYARNDRYTDEAHNTSGLLPWEVEALERDFPRHGRVLVLGAGGGREVLALEQRGFIVEAFDCHPKLVEYGKHLLRKLGMNARLGLIGENQVPAIGGFDAAIVGWGAYMHVPGRARRVRFLRDIHKALVPGGAVLLSFFVRQGTGRRDAWIAGLANTLRRMRRRGDDLVEVGDRLEGSFDHYFTEGEIREELEASGFRVAHYAQAAYGHAVGIAEDPPVRAAASDQRRL